MGGYALPILNNDYSNGQSFMTTTNASKYRFISLRSFKLWPAIKIVNAEFLLNNYIILDSLTVVQIVSSYATVAAIVSYNTVI